VPDIDSVAEVGDALWSFMISSVVRRFRWGVEALDRLRELVDNFRGGDLCVFEA